MNHTKIILKIIAMAALYGIASGLSRRIWEL